MLSISGPRMSLMIDCTEKAVKTCPLPNQLGADEGVAGDAAGGRTGLWARLAQLENALDYRQLGRRGVEACIRQVQCAHDERYALS